MDPKEINIVLVGETGVGKSTFINAFVNYLKFANLEDATKSPDIYCVIASKFTVTNDKFEEEVIQFGEDDGNENGTVGSSCTQFARSYTFNFDRFKVRLIDTPGIGDTRGVAKDEENFDRLLDVLGELQYIHAFCILLKPNNARLTVLFQYCIKQLLCRLDKTASQNIIFVFTNSRTTFYKPGDTLGPLKAMLNEIGTSPPYVTIPFSVDNVFCMDNEAFRFVLASRHKIHFDDAEKRDFAASWEKSADVSLKLLVHAANLQPHKMQNTISLNEAKRLILNLSEPLAMVAKNIDDNLRIIQRHERELQDESKTKEELEKILYFDMIKLKIIELDAPETVCTDSKCIEVHMIEGTKNIHYKQICHEICYLKRVPKEVRGAPELKQCSAMEKSFFNYNPVCRHCKHSYLLHMHIYFKTEAYNSREVNIKADSDIKATDAKIRTIQSAIEDLKEKKRRLDNEKGTVEKSMAKFAHFLNNNAIVPYNDKYKDYILYLIELEKSMGSKRDINLIRSYEQMIGAYEEQVDILDSQLKNKKIKDEDAIVISAEEVMATVTQLYNLEINGPTIKKFYETQQRHRQHETLFNTERIIDSRWYDGFVQKYNKYAPSMFQIGSKQLLTPKKTRPVRK